MPTLAELILALATDQPLSADEKREVALHVPRLPLSESLCAFVHVSLCARTWDTSSA